MMEQYLTDQQGQTTKRKVNRVLLDERPLVLLPSLASVVGVNGAIVIQQLHFHLTGDGGRIHAGEKWIYKTYQQWQANDFQCWSIPQIKRIFRALSRRKLVISCQPEGRLSRRKYYRINYQALDAMLDGDKIVPSKGTKSSLPINETTQDETTTQVQKYAVPELENTQGSSGDDRAVFSSRKRRRVPKSEEEMYEILESLGIEPDPDHDGGFFDEMQACYWTIRGKPIRNWPAVYKGRLERATRNFR